VWRRGGKASLENKKIWDPLRKLFSPPGVPSWLQVWFKIKV